MSHGIQSFRGSIPLISTMKMADSLRKHLKWKYFRCFSFPLLGVSLAWGMAVFSNFSAILPSFFALQAAERYPLFGVLNIQPVQELIQIKIEFHI